MSAPEPFVRATEDLRACMRLFPTGVALLTTGRAGDVVGMTVNSVTSVSLEPPLVLVSVHRQARIRPVIAGCGVFALSLLAADQTELARRFAGRDRPDGVGAMSAMGGRPGCTGVPIPRGALGFIECKLHESLSAGDHILVIGLVLRAVPLSDRAPQLFHRGILTAAVSAAGREESAP